MKKSLSKLIWNIWIYILAILVYVIFGTVLGVVWLFVYVMHVCNACFLAILSLFDRGAKE